MKFYELAHAPQSVISVGQNLVDDFCVHNDFEGARDVIEKTLLPTVQALNLVSWVVPVRSQYAVVLAYAGQFDAADNEIRRLAPYEAGLSPAGKGELQAQRRLIASLRRSGPPPQRKVVIPPPVKELIAARNGQAAPPQSWTKIGRNERCPCQSGRKYKYCHGR